jgi:hypothetical protein
MIRASISLALVAGLALAAGAAAQAPAPSRLDDLVERFMTIVQRGAPDRVEPWTGPEEREILLRLNPGRERQVDEYTGRTAQCVGRVMDEAMPRAARASARALGEERLARLVDFHEGPAGQAIDRARRDDRQPSLSPSQEEEQAELRHDYRIFMYSIPNHLDQESFDRAIRCHEDEAARLHLRTE